METATPSFRSIIGVCLGASVLSAHEPPQSSLKTDTSAVMVDVVFRDKKGNPVTPRSVGLELLEDGIPQDMGG